jgi:hypothetical protein
MVGDPPSSSRRCAKTAVVVVLPASEAIEEERDLDVVSIVGRLLGMVEAMIGSGWGMQRELVDEAAEGRARERLRMFRSERGLANAGLPKRKSAEASEAAEEREEVWAD